MLFSLFYFADDAASTAGERYALLMDGARFADDHDLHAVWTPERHFHRFGGLYPNPSVTGAAVAAVTSRVAVRAGSVVLPLHDPVRVAEEWSVVDNLSGGRAAMAFASGWHAVDFVLGPDTPDRYERRRQTLVEHVDTVRRLWRGETVERLDGAGNPAEVRIFPPPVQPELPFWITSSGNPQTFRMAGELGGNLLTHLLGQDTETLSRNIATYRAALAEAHGTTRRGQVTLMVHTLLGDSDESVLAEVREPFSRYLASSLDLIMRSTPTTTGLTDVSGEDRRVLVDRAFERYARDSGLFGSLETTARAVLRFAEAGVDEVACLIDFGVPRARVLAGLDLLAKLAEDAA